MSKSKRVRVVVVAAALLAPAVSCATAQSLGVVLSDDVDAALTVGGQTGVGGGASAATGAGGIQVEDPNDWIPPSVGGSPETSPPATGGMQGSGGQPLPVGMGGRPGFPPARGTGGTTGAGGATGAAGMSVSVGGGSSTPMTCASTEKMCGGVCAAPSPKVGCGMTGCDPCTVTAPKNGYVTCVNGMCQTDCLSGFTKMGMECQGPPPGTNQGNCPNSALGCPDCGAVFGPGCCAGSKCGCSPIPWTVGILGCI